MSKKTRKFKIGDKVNYINDNGVNWGERKAAAKLIRKELKAAFPGVVFSITSRSFAGGNDVQIDWTDGPTFDTVMKIAGKYEYGHFNGMEDIYEYSNSRDDIPQVKFVMAQREFSETARENAKNKIMKDRGLNDFEDKTVWDKIGCWPDTAIYRELQKTVL